MAQLVFSETLCVFSRLHVRLCCTLAAAHVAFVITILISDEAKKKAKCFSVCPLRN